MEIIFEILFQLLLFLFEVAGDTLIPLFFEGMSALTGHTWNRSVNRSSTASPVAAFFGYVFLGLFCGGLSLWIMPHAVIQDPLQRLINLFLSPLLVGMLMMGIGRYRVVRGKNLLRLETFFYAWLCAFIISGIRYFWAS